MKGAQRKSNEQACTMAIGQGKEEFTSTSHKTGKETIRKVAGYNTNEQSGNEQYY